MAVITTEKLGATVGAAGQGRRHGPPAARRRAARRGASRRSRPTAPSCSATSTSTTRPRWRSASKLGKVEIFGKGEHPEIFRVTLDPAKNPSAAVPARHLRLAHRRLHRRHPDHGHDAQRPRRGRDRAARPSSPAPTPPTTTSTDDEKERLDVGAGGAHDRGVAAAVQQRPLARGGGDLAHAPGQGAPARVAAPLGPQVARARRHHRPRRGHGPRRGPGAARRPARPGRPRPTASTATSGRSATW